MNDLNDLTPNELRLAESRRDVTMKRFHMLRRRRFMTRSAIAVAVTGAALGVGLALGTSGGRAARTLIVAPPPTTEASSATVFPTPSTTTKLAPAPYADAAENPGFEAARIQWEGAGLGGGSVYQNFAIPIAIHDLEVGESSDADATSGYASAIANLNVILSMPDAMVTHTMSAEGSAASAALDGFFHLTQSPYEPSGGVSCSNSADKAAADAWTQEPHTNTAGVTVSPLKQAIADLQTVEECSPDYLAAIADLEDLEGVSAAGIEKSGANPNYGVGSSETIAGYEISYLNYLFNLDTSPVLTPPYYQLLLTELQAAFFPNSGLPTGVSAIGVGPWQYVDAGHVGAGYEGSAGVSFSSNAPSETVHGNYDVFATTSQAKAAFEAASANFEQSPSADFSTVNLGSGAQAFCGAQPNNASTCWFHFQDVNGSVGTSTPITDTTGSTVLKAMFAHLESFGFEWPST